MLPATKRDGTTQTEERHNSPQREYQRGGVYDTQTEGSRQVHVEDRRGTPVYLGRCRHDATV